MTVVLPDRPGS